ncbi:flagellin [uncultured Enterovirga sp.]|uniref:flagellin n=1 Tax=uncultured Enterovirga sp. TaxID=2026352 RepID=UPI0035CBEC28
MSIQPYGSGALAARQAVDAFRNLKTDLASLEGQLSTGRAADNYAGLGAGAATSLSTRSALSTLEGYAANVTDAKVRVSLMSQAVGRLAQMASGLATSLPQGLNGNPVGQTSSTISASDALQQAIELLNTDMGGRYLFSGRSADTEPVASYASLIDGEPGRAGLRQLIAERKEADLGAGGRGRLVPGGSGIDATLTEEAAGLPFGMKLTSATATGTGITAARSAGPPPSVAMNVAAQPADGDAVTIEFGLPDGTSERITLTARADGAIGPSANAFAIGATPAATAANLRAALDAAVRTTATTALASASTRKAAESFFAGSASSPPERVAGPPFATATGTVPGTSANTTVWYAGDDAAGSARGTSPVRTGDGAGVAIGARANEPGIRSVLAALGALAADTFPASDATSAARYTALAQRISAASGTSPVQDIATDFGVANAQLGQAATRLSAAKVQLNDTLGEVENADPNEAAAKLLATQTRLQASYQVTSTVAQLSLVNFI